MWHEALWLLADFTTVIMVVRAFNFIEYSKCLDKRDAYFRHKPKKDSDTAEHVFAMIEMGWPVEQAQIAMRRGARVALSLREEKDPYWARSIASSIKFMRSIPRIDDFAKRKDLVQCAVWVMEVAVGCCHRHWSPSPCCATHAARPGWVRSLTFAVTGRGFGVSTPERTAIHSAILGEP